MTIESHHLPNGSLPRDLAERYLGLVRRHAYRLARRLPSHVSVDDLIGAGCVGLADALKKFDRSSGDRFESYAECRIRGAMIDELRLHDVLSRDLRELNKRIVAAVRALTAELGKPPEEVEIAQRLNVSVAVFREQLAKLSFGGLVSLDTSGEANEGFEVGDDAVETPEQCAGRSQWRHRLAEAVEALPERLQTLLQLYYQHDFTLREIGERLGVTESRACQLHAEAILRLRASSSTAPHREEETEGPSVARVPTSRRRMRAGTVMCRAS